MSKTSARSLKPCANKDNISVSMVPHQNTLKDRQEYRYKIECFGCPRACDYSFIYHSKLSFAFVGKLAGVFSSRCSGLVGLDENKPAQDGQLSLLSNVESNDNESEEK